MVARQGASDAERVARQVSSDIEHANVVRCELDRQVSAHRDEEQYSQNAHLTEGIARLSVESECGTDMGVHKGDEYPMALPTAIEVKWKKEDILRLIEYRCRRYDKMREFLSMSNGMDGVLDLSVIDLSIANLEWEPPIGARVDKVRSGIRKLLIDKKLEPVTSYQIKMCLHYAVYSGKECTAYMCLLVSRFASLESQMAFHHISIQSIAASREGVAKAWIDSLKSFAVQNNFILSTQVSNKQVAKDFWAARFFRSRSYMKYTLILAHASRWRLPIYADVDGDYGFDM